MVRRLLAASLVFNGGKATGKGARQGKHLKKTILFPPFPLLPRRLPRRLVVRDPHCQRE
jgi:hypothetical protein